MNPMMVVHLSLRGCVCHPQLHLDKYSRKEEFRIRRDYLLHGILCLQTQDSSCEGSHTPQKLRNKVVVCLRVLICDYAPRPTTHIGRTIFVNDFFCMQLIAPARLLQKLFRIALLISHWPRSVSIISTFIKG